MRGRVPGPRVWPQGLRLGLFVVVGTLCCARSACDRQARATERLAPFSAGRFGADESLRARVHRGRRPDVAAKHASPSRPTELSSKPPTGGAKNSRTSAPAQKGCVPTLAVRGAGSQPAGDAVPEAPRRIRPWRGNDWTEHTVMQHGAAAPSQNGKRAQDPHESAAKPDAGTPAAPACGHAVTAVRGEPPLLRKAKPNGGGAAKCGVVKIQRIFLKANDDSAKPQDGGAAKGSADRIQRAFLKAREILQKKRMASRQKVSAESNEAGRDEVEVLQGQAPCFAGAQNSEELAATEVVAAAVAPCAEKLEDDGFMQETVSNVTVTMSRTMAMVEAVSVILDEWRLQNACELMAAHYMANAQRGGDTEQCAVLDHQHVAASVLDTAALVEAACVVLHQWRLRAACEGLVIHALAAALAGAATEEDEGEQQSEVEKVEDAEEAGGGELEHCVQPTPSIFLANKERGLEMLRLFGQTGEGPQGHTEEEEEAAAVAAAAAAAEGLLEETASWGIGQTGEGPQGHNEEEEEGTAAATAAAAEGLLEETASWGSGQTGQHYAQTEHLQRRNDEEYQQQRSAPAYQPPGLSDLLLQNQDVWLHSWHPPVQHQRHQMPQQQHQPVLEQYQPVQQQHEPVQRPQPQHRPQNQPGQLQQEQEEREQQHQAGQWEDTDRRPAARRTGEQSSKNDYLDSLHTHKEAQQMLRKACERMRHQLIALPAFGVSTSHIQHVQAEILGHTAAAREQAGSLLQSVQAKGFKV